MRLGIARTGAERWREGEVVAGAVGVVGEVDDKGEGADRGIVDVDYLGVTGWQGRLWWHCVEREDVRECEKEREEL
jgi:hypothetical protein